MMDAAGISGIFSKGRQREKKPKIDEALRKLSKRKGTDIEGYKLSYMFIPYNMIHKLI